MTGLIETADERQKDYDEYLDLLVKRDQFFRDARSYEISYMAEFGDQIIENFKIKLECIRKKKMISYCRRHMNRGLPVDSERMRGEIEKEMRLYRKELADMLADIEEAKKAECVSSIRLEHAKKIYRRLAMLLHPDANQRTMTEEILKDLWNRIVRAYERLDADELDDLEVLVHRALAQLGDENFEPDLSDMEDRMERIERQISEILATEPYIYGAILEDRDKASEHRERLLEEYHDYERYLENLTNALDELLREGGIRLVWKMN